MTAPTKFSRDQQEVYNILLEAYPDSLDRNEVADRHEERNPGYEDGYGGKTPKDPHKAIADQLAYAYKPLRLANRLEMLPPKQNPRYRAIPQPGGMFGAATAPAPEEIQSYRLWQREQRKLRAQAREFLKFEAGDKEWCAAQQRMTKKPGKQEKIYCPGCGIGHHSADFFDIDHHEPLIEDSVIHPERHCRQNYQLLCPKCNQFKNNRLTNESLRARNKQKRFMVNERMALLADPFLRGRR